MFQPVLKENHEREENVLNLSKVREHKARVSDLNIPLKKLKRFKNRSQ